MRFEKKKPVRTFLSVSAMMHGLSGYLVVSDEYNYVQFRKEVGDSNPVNYAALLERLRALAPRVPLLRDIQVHCSVCNTWHPVMSCSGPKKSPCPMPNRRRK